jgi:hypothetical protein
LLAKYDDARAWWGKVKADEEAGRCPAKVSDGAAALVELWAEAVRDHEELMRVAAAWLTRRHGEQMTRISRSFNE